MEEKTNQVEKKLKKLIQQNDIIINLENEQDNQNQQQTQLYFQDSIRDELNNNMTFNQMQQNNYPETKRDEISSFIDSNNNNFQNNFHSSLINLNLQVQKSLTHNNINNNDKSQTQYDKSDYDSCQVSNSDHNNTTSQQNQQQNQQSQQGIQQQQPRRSNKQSRSIFVSEKNTLRKVSTKLKMVLSFQGSPIQIASNFIKIRMFGMLRKKMRYFKNNFTNIGRNNYLESNNNKIRKIIQDKGDYIQNKEKNKFTQQMKRLVHFITCFLFAKCYKYNNSFMILPNSLLNLFSLVIFSSFNVLFFFLLSIIIIFQGYNKYEEPIIRFITVTYFIEVLVQLSTQIYEQTNLIFERDKVFSIYMKQKAIFDVTPIIILLFLPDDLILRKVFLAITFIKIKTVYPDINKMQKLLCMRVKNYYIIQLFNLIFKVLVISHIVACVWYLIGQIELKFLGYDTTWYDESLGSDYVWWKLYLESMYWSLTLMTTGSNVANSIPQMLFTSFIMLFTTIIFGYLLNTTGIILSNIDEKDENKRMDLNIINDYMRANNISKQLQGRVNLDLEYYYLHNLKKDAEQKQEVIKKISPHLQNLLKFEYCKQALEKMNFLTKYFSQETINELMIEFQEEFYSPNQLIIQERQNNIINNNNINDNNLNNQIQLILIIQGEAEMIQQYQSDKEDNKKTIETYKQGDLIGQINFFTGQDYSYSVKALKFTKVISIKRERFLEIIKKRSKDYEKFCDYRDRQKYYQEYQGLNYNCGFCQSNHHQTQECNLIHINKSIMYQKAQFLEKLDQNRQSNFNRNSYRINTYLILKDIQVQIQKYAWIQFKKTPQYQNMNNNGNHNNNEKYSQKQLNFLSDHSSLVNNSQEFIQNFSSFNILSSQQYSDSDSDLSVNEAQQVRNQQYFDKNNQLRYLNINQNKKKKKYDHEKDKDIISPSNKSNYHNTHSIYKNSHLQKQNSLQINNNSVNNNSILSNNNQIHLNSNTIIQNNNSGIQNKNNQNQNDLISRYHSQFQKRNSLFNSESQSKRISIISIDNNLNNNINNNNINLNSNNNLYKTNNNIVKNSMLDVQKNIDDSSPQQSRLTNKSNQIQRQDSIYKEVSFLEKLKQSNKLDKIPYYGNNSKGYIESNKYKLNNQDNKRNQQLIKQASLNPQQTIPGGVVVDDDLNNKKKQQFMLNLDTFRNWIYYFVNGNPRNVISKYNKKIKKRIKKKSQTDKTQKNSHKNIHVSSYHSQNNHK